VVFALLAVLLPVALCAPSLVASPVSVIYRENITVTWSGISSVHPEDFIGLFSDTGISMLNKSCGFFNLGSGNVTFTVMNMRLNYVFKYFSKKIFGGDTVVLESNIVAVEANLPMQGHLALTGDPTQISLIWVSNSTNAPQATIGTDPSKSVLVVDAVTSTYSLSDFCSSSANDYFYYWPPGNIHKVLFTNLSPLTTYYYQFGSHVDGLWSEVFNFTSPPQIGNLDHKVNVIAFGDMGTYMCDDLPQYNQCDSPSQSTIGRISALMANESFDFLLHIGDISYAVGREWTWDQFFAAIEPVATNLPYMTAVGNHDGTKNPANNSAQPFHPTWAVYNDDSNSECGVPYTARFAMPNTNITQMWYSFDYGPMHIAVMSTEHNFTAGSVQYEWLLSDLKTVDRAQTPWLIVTGHRPMYYTHLGVDGVETHLQETLEPVFQEFQVDMALWGHVHAYERTCAIRNGTCVKENGTVHVLIGMAGRELSSLCCLAKDWSLYREATYGFTYFSVSATELQFNFVANEDGKIHDSFSIVKK